MDDIRRFRLLVAPFVFLGWLAIGLWDDPTWHQRFICALHKDSKIELAALVAIGVAASLPLGFLIHQAGYLLAWCMHRLWASCRGNCGMHLEALPDLYESTEAAKALQSKLERCFQAEVTKENAHFATAVLAYEIANPAIGQWIARSWSTVMISANTAAALLLAVGARLLFVGWRGIACWVVATVVFSLLLWLLGCRSWLLTMGMIRFQAQREPRPPQTARPT